MISKYANYFKITGGNASIETNSALHNFAGPSEPAHAGECSPLDFFRSAILISIRGPDYDHRINTRLPLPIFRPSYGPA